MNIKQLSILSFVSLIVISVFIITLGGERKSYEQQRYEEFKERCWCSNPNYTLSQFCR